MQQLKFALSDAGFTFFESRHFLTTVNGGYFTFADLSEIYSFIFFNEIAVFGGNRDRSPISSKADVYVDDFSLFENRTFVTFSIHIKMHKECLA